MKKSKNNGLFILLIIFFLFLSIFLVKIYKDNKKAYSHLSDEMKILNENLNNLILFNEEKFKKIDMGLDEVTSKFSVLESKGQKNDESLLNELYRVKRVLSENRDSVDSINVTTEQMKLILNNGFNQIGVDEVNKEALLEMVFNEGISYFEEKKYLESLKIFKEAQAIYPYDREIKFYYLASLYYSNPQKTTNFPFLKEQLELLTHDQEYTEKAYLILLDIYLSEDNLEKASAIYRALFRQDETKYEYLKSLALLEFELYQFDRAIEDFKSYLYINIKDYEAIYYLALSLVQTSRLEEALAQFYKVRESNESFSKLEEKILEIEQKLELNGEL